MFLAAGALSLALLLASRLLGLVRESAQAAAFGATGLADVAVLMLSLPDWLAGVLAGGGLAYVLLPAWAGQTPGQVAASQRRVAQALLLGGCVLAVAAALWHPALVAALAAGLPPQLLPQAERAVLWSAAALPLALLAALWATRLQHGRDFLGMYAANLVVNAIVIATLVLVAWSATPSAALAVLVLGAGLLAAMLARLGWLWWRQRRLPRAAPAGGAAVLPRTSVWLWALLAAGLPLALPFAARSLASQQGPGALAIFNYAWKLAELPFLLAVQLVATLALGPIALAVRGGGPPDAAAATIRRGFALAWTLACAATLGLLLAAPAVAQLLFGWGRMQPQALDQIAAWGRVAAWGLLPQSLLAIALAVLAAQARLRTGALAYGAALLLLLAWHPADGGNLMRWLNLLWTGVALAAMLALGPALLRWLPWRALAVSGGVLLGAHGAARLLGTPSGLPLQFALAVLAGLALLALTWAGSPDLRAALKR